MFKKLFPIAILFCLFFPSCSSFIDSNESASINLEITGSLIKKLAESSTPPPSSARSINGLEGVSQYKIRAVLTADGSEYVEEAFIQKSSSSSVTITFPAVRAGSRAKIIVHILIGNYEYARGESDEITVKAGSNFLIIKIGKNAILPILLYNTINSEKVFSLSSNPDSYGDYSVEIDSDKSVPFTPKAKLFAFINGGESPADGDLDIPYTQYTSYGNTITTYYTPTYSFGDNCLYWLYQNKVYVYTAPDYNNPDELDLISKFKEINTALADYTLTIKGLAYYDGSLYFFINYNSQYYFAAYNLEDSNLIFASENLLSGGAYEKPCDSLAVTKIGENYILCSINVNFSSSPIALYIQKFTITKNENGASILTLDETPSIIGIPVTDSDFYGSYDNGFGGLQILGNTLYVTCYFYRGPSHDVQAYFLNPNTDSIFPVMSAGGLGKIDLSSSSYEFGTWINGEKLLGLYKNYYYLKNEDETYTKLNAVIMTPPEDKASSYFYGAKRIIAKKQDEIVIADDGAYVEIKGDRTDKNAIKKCVNKNRVVTVNLKNESISAVDVNASFSSTLGTGTFYGIE